LGEDEHQVEDIYNLSFDERWEGKSSEHDISLSFEGLQLEASMDLR
jgi:hypothetical protein